MEKSLNKSAVGMLIQNIVYAEKNVFVFKIINRRELNNKIGSKILEMGKKFIHQFYFCLLGDNDGQ